MKTPVEKLICKHVFPLLYRRYLIPFGLVLTLMFSLSLPAMAGEASSPDLGEQGTLVDLRGLSISEIEKMFPMSPEVEAAIVHSAPLCPVIINDVRYEGNQISFFNGKRLRFVNGKDGSLYAFSTLEGFLKFQSQYELEDLRQDVEISTFFLDIIYSGSSMGVPAGGTRRSLDPIFDNSISSLKVSVDASWAYLFDYPNFTGDWYGFPRGSSYPNLSNQGWDNRASSILVNE